MLGLALISGTAWALGETTRVSVATTGEQGNFSSGSAALSADGRFVAFASHSSNLVAGDTNKNSDIFVHDHLTHQTQQVSIAAPRVHIGSSSGHSSSPILSADGRFVAFRSAASNLVRRDANKAEDIFVHDRLTHKTECVSVTTTGEQGNKASISPAISADGRFVAFASYARNLVAEDTNRTLDIFVHDRLTHKTQRVSVTTTGEQGNLGSFSPALSADGRFVAFVSGAHNLVAGDTNRRTDIFVHDRLTHETQRVSVATTGKQGNDSSYSPVLSADGRFVAFVSKASNLVAGDTNDQRDVFVHDRLTHENQRVSVEPSGKQVWYGDFDSLSLSADGRFVAFNSAHSNFVKGDTNNALDAFVHDRLTHETQRVSIATDGVQGNSGSGSPILSADGRFVAFSTGASNLVAGDTNGYTDIFVRDRLLNQDLSADLAIEVTEQPTSLVHGGLGQYTYTITNHGPNPVNSVQITHSVANGQVRKWIPSQGHCRHYTAISLCDLRTLAGGASLTLTADIKAIRKDLRQQISVAGGPSDPQATNNSVNVDTLVTP